MARPCTALLGLPPITHPFYPAQTSQKHRGRGLALQAAPSPPPTNTTRRSILLPTLLCCSGAPLATVGRNPALDKLFARAMAEGMGDYEAAIAPVKRRLFSQLSEARCIDVVELGAGTGPNLAYYGPEAMVTAVDLNMYMQPFFKENMARLGWEENRVKWIEASAADIPLESGSQDAVVCTLLLCSVDDVPKVINEAKRLLKPGGKLLFIEHTIAPQDQLLLKLGQWVLNPLQRALADGCNLTRDPLPSIKGAGFQEVDATRFSVDGMSFIAPHVAGIATV